MSDDLINRVKKIGEREIMINNTHTSLLTEDEIENLTISRGTLSSTDRKIMEDHGGEIELTHNPSGGAVVKLIFKNEN